MEKIDRKLQIIVGILFGVVVYIIVTSFFVSYSFNLAFQSYNKKLELIRDQLKEITSQIQEISTVKQNGEEKKNDN
jgi:alpha-N-acetylglucosamine transferase